MLDHTEGRLRFLRRAADRPRHRFRRGVYLLPSLLTMGNMFCGYACVVYAMRGAYETPAPFIGMPSPAAAAIPAATVFAYPVGLYDYRAALPALAMVLVPAVLMVSTIRFRSFKTLDSQKRRPYTVLLFIAAGIILIATHPQVMLVVIAYGYLASAFIGLAISRLKRRDGRAAVDVDPLAASNQRDSAAG